ncbi:UDP-N-acetylglucosamine 2-epimerase (non-hydrolyzing) [Herbidospora sp. NBRC 101105]|uniref:non-hydrolyzing UDP-N-acetylglucosamine 2-epimerase n=1 Tax=Herbidospora sp. NBRC 101105 TaxID=3032195 RepID=UPI0024A05D14|nr:UDP-N-acetylglucosamine 2-epimerase (non-hydrolyzing) [Herbidospora sp. NBRC 101105]GLX95990.1 UDP-N-acetyl glucosamine 2-epimerase [Herbidospora sp. NBRC 101105]
MSRVCVVVGTRPEAIKLGPVIPELRAFAGVDVVHTGQHDGAVVGEVLALFGAGVSHELRREAATLPVLTAEVVLGLDEVFARLRPDLVVVQGDTTSAFGGALAAYLRRVPIAHVEAGLRSHRLTPFPEEANRRLIAPLADLHLAPTASARANLLAERIPADRVLVTGNTVVDALAAVLADRPAPRDRPVVVITAHRRESWGEPMRRVARVADRLAAAHPGVDFVVATHLNPAVRQVFDQVVRPRANIRCVPPMPYREFARLLAVSALAITDSGGVQEEAAALGLPVLVMRDSTERVEALDDGGAHLVGTDEELVTKTAGLFLQSAVAGRVRHVAPCHYGDGHAAARVARACAELIHSEN